MRQSSALDILKTGQNVFLTGSAGSGKTYTLNQYIDYLRARRVPVAVTASTGIAATHMNGTTIHSWSGIGIKDELKGELPIAFCVLKDHEQVATTENRFRIEQQVIGAVVKSLGGIARPAAIYFPQALPKTRSGKILRRAIRALAEGNETGDMSTLDNPTAIDAIKQSMKDY